MTGRGSRQPTRATRPGSDQGTAGEDSRDKSAPTTATTADSQDKPKAEKKGDKKEDWYEEAMANAERDLAEDAEWKRIQENTFTRWVNEHLRQANTSINDLETDFSNGLKLIALLEVLSGKKMPRYNKKPTFRSQKLENVSIALKFLENEGVYLVNIDSFHITDCKLKLIMGLIWTLILHYSISMPMYDGPELGGHKQEEKTPKQRLLGWMQNKIPGVPINNFTSDWTDGIKVGALVDSVAPGLCPDWEDWDPNEPIRNATEAMDLADSWLGVPKLLTPEEIINPNVDEQSMMTYLSQFPNAKVKEGAPFREKALASKVRAHGPGLEPTGNVAKAPAKFTVETFGAGDGDLSITVKGPDGTDYKVDKTYNNDRKKSYSCSYFPDKEGDFTVPILFAGRNIPKSPFKVAIEGFAGDANKVTVAGPGVEPEGVVANRPTDFDIFTEGAGRGKPEVIVLDPHGLKDAIPVKITPTGNDVYHCEYLPSQLGVHSVNVFFAGNPIPDSPFGVRVGPASNPNKVHASGRGLQPHGVRAQELVDFKVFTEGAGEGVASVKIIGPGGIITPTTSRNVDPHTIEYKYTPERDGRYRVMITWAGKEIQRSPYEVNVSPLKSSKIKAFGPGLQGGVVDMPALFSVDTCGETGALGFSIEGPSQAKINCNDNGDGSADVDYVPTVAGEYAVHILCDNEDIPGSPYMAQILPKTDYDPGKVKCYGPGLEEVVQPNEETFFTIDAREAGKAPLDVLFVDDYGEVKPLWKDENGIHDPKEGGILAVKIIKAKELIKGDVVGKSDPYAVIKHGAQKYSTKVVKNSHEPEWNYEAQVTIPDQGDNTVTIQLWDKDRLGKDTSLGEISFETSRLVREKVIEQGWYKLAGVKSGQVLMSADFVPVSPSLAKDAIREQRKMSRKMSHKNLDVRRPILEKKSEEGMFECHYTPRKTQKLVICVNYGGVAVPDSPFRVTVDDPTDPNKVKVYGKGVEDGNKTGKPVEFTVDCKEAGPGDLAVNITDDKGDEVTINMKDNSNQTYTVQYNPKKNGPHIIEVKYDGRDVPQSPITVNVKTDIDLRKVKVVGLNDEVFVDCTNDFEVDTSALPADVTPNIGCSIKTPDGGQLKDLKVEQPRAEDAKPARAKVSYTPNKEGKHEVTVTCDGDPIHGSPFKIKAKKGFDPKKVKAYGPGLEQGIVQEPNQFTVETRNAGKGDLGLAIEGPAEAKMTCKDNQDGSCNVDYIPTVPGPYEVFIKFEDKNIPGSPFKVPVTDPSGALSKDGAELTPGKLNLKVIKAKELIKADLVGKSDPYVKISYGGQNFKTPTVKNSLEPRWDYDCSLNVPEAQLSEVRFEVFDADKLGKDKSLGVVNVSVGELSSLNDAQGRWYSLTGVKSGQILLSADFIESEGLDNEDPNNTSYTNKSPGDGQGGKLPSSGPLPLGRAQVFIVKAKDLVKADLIGKSDPYAKLSYASQSHKTPTVKNTQEPKWDFVANFDVPEGDKRNVLVEVFDADKLGRDKSLGKVEVDLADLVNSNDEEGRWYPLTGVKSGKVLLFADFQEDGTYDPKDPSFVPHNLRAGDDEDGRRKSSVGDKNGDSGNDLPTGVAKINLIKAADLIKTDIIGKSDPYAVLSHGGQKDKTKTIKNSQDPTWNHVSEFKVPDTKDCRTFNIEVFDSDKIGKDKSLGALSLDILDVLELDGGEGRWFPLDGVKSGKVLLAADFLDDLGRRASEILPGLLKNGDPRPEGGLVSDSPPINNDGVGNDGDNQNSHPSALNGDVPIVPASALPSGKAKINLIKAKELIQADKNSKSDPYAMLLYGRQVEKTKVVPNSHEPQWNHEAEFEFPEGDERTFRIQLFDSDKVGKDMSLGHLDLDITDVLALDGQQGQWFPLSGVASGQVLLSADFIDDLGRNAGDLLNNLLRGLDPDSNPADRKSSLSNPDKNNLSDDDIPHGVATINLVKARNLMKIDPNEKPHPYAVVIHGKQMEKTKTVKNSTEPTWDHKAEFRVPDNHSSEFFIEVFDNQRSGKDKSLGCLALDIVDVLELDGNKKGQWFPLDDTHSGEILLTADFLDDLGRRPSDILKDLLKNNPDRKRSGDKQGGNPNDGDDANVVRLDIIKAKDLIKTDLIGKSDPYAVIKCGSQQDKTPVAKNTQNPVWNHSSELIIPVTGDDKPIAIEVFDHDKLGKDKSLGKLELSLDDIQDMSDSDDAGRWFPLAGVKSGQILLSADVLDQLGDGETGGQAKANKNRQGDNGLSDRDGDNSGKLSDQEPGSDGKAHVNLIKAKDLFKPYADPYAIINYGTQKFKTPTVENSQEPEWDCEMEFDFPEGDEDIISIQVFDEADGDECLGTLDLHVDELGAMQPDTGYWFPLAGVDSGEILLSGDIVDSSGDLGSGNDADQGLRSGDQAPEGQLEVKVVKARDLVKADMFGKSDPYAVLKYGSQKDKTPVVKNTQNPEWNHDSFFQVPDGQAQTLNLEVFDADKLGKDKSLGKLDVDLDELLDAGNDGAWYELQGVKSGQILLSSDLLPLDGLQDKNKVGSGLGAKDDIPEGVIHLDLVKAKDLNNEDKKGKSDPYAVLKYGKQKAKTNTIKNTQDPQWNFSTDFNVPDGEESKIDIELFDNDKFGRDKSLGKLKLDIGDLLANNLADGAWYPLDGSDKGQVFIATDFRPGDGELASDKDKLGSIMGGKGTGPADPTKVTAYGPGLEPGQVMPGKPTTFTVDSSRTGPAPIDVDIETDGRVSSRSPSIAESGPGRHEVTYVPPPIGHPYQIGVKYGGQDIPGSPFEMTSNADTSDVLGDDDGAASRKTSAAERKESKIGVSVNPDNDNNLGKIQIGLLEAKDLTKTDLVGKSDPYATLSHGNQKFKTDTMKNTQNPKFNYEAVFNVPDNGDNSIKIELKDCDKFGRDKPLGTALIDVDDVMTQGELPPTWYPLKGGKQGQVLVTANFEPSDSSRFASPERGLQGLDSRKQSQLSDAGRKPSQGSRKGSGLGDGASGLKNKLLNGSGNEDDINPEDIPEGTLHLDILGARNLPKTDLIGKSDPYAEVGLGDQVHKTPTVKNSQDPEWNFGADFDLDGSQPTDVELNVFDSDKLGKDKPLGSALLPVSDLLERAMDPQAGPVWVPLAGVKSGEVLVDTNFSPLGEDSARRMSGHGTGKSRNPNSRQDSQASLLGDDNDGAGGGRALRDKLKDSKKKAGGSSSPLNEDLIPGNLHLSLIQAEGLPKGDLIGKSDPYAVISVDGDKHKTQTVKNSQNPEWNFELDIPVDEAGPHDIKIDVFDKDRIGKDKLLGSTNISMDDLQNKDLDREWLPLTGSKPNCGQIQVSTEFSPEGLDDDGPGGSRSGRPSYALGDRPGQAGDLGDGVPAGNVHLALHEAQGLGKGDLVGKSDPYAVVSYDGNSDKTPVAKNDNNPKWNYETDLPVQEDGPRNINIDVFDKDRFGKDKLLGSTSLDIGDMIDQPFNEEWLPLDGSKTGGQMKVSADFAPSDGYNALSSSRKSSMMSESYSRKTSTMSESYSRKQSEISVAGSRRTSEMSMSGSRRTSEMSTSGSRRTSEMNESRKESELGSSRRPLNMPGGDESGGALSLKKKLDGVPDESYLYGSGPNRRDSQVGSRKGSQADGLDNYPGSGSRKGSHNDPDNDPLRRASQSNSRKGSQYDPSGRKGSQGDDDLNDYPGSGSRKGSQFDAAKDGRRGSQQGGNRKGSQYDPDSDPSGRRGSQGDGFGDYPGSGSRKGSQNDTSRKGSYGDKDPHGSRKGSQYDHNAGSGSRKGSSSYDDPNGGRKGSQSSDGRGGALSLKKKLDGVPDESYLYGTDPNSRKGSQDDSRYGDRKGSQDDSRFGSRKGSQYDAEDDSTRSSSRKGSQMDPDDVELNNRKNSGQGGARKLKDDLGRQKSGYIGPLHEDVIPVGNVHLELAGAKNLIKADMIGKSDPYAVISYGDDSYRTKTVKNDLNPEFDFEKDIQVNPDGPRAINIALYDDDKLGRDKPLGNADIDIATLVKSNGLKDALLPLDGVKSGVIQVSADFTPYDQDLDGQGSRKGSKAGGKLIPEPQRDGMRERGGSPRMNSDDTFGQSPSVRKSSQEPSPGLIHLGIVQAKDLVKADMLGKSDPFAVVTYGDNQLKTDTVKNNLNPEFNFEADIPYNPNYSDNLKIELFDDDKLGKNKSLGSTVLDIPSLVNNDPLDNVWVPLDGVKSGQLQLCAEYVPMNGDMSPSRDSGSLGAPRSAGDNGDKLGSIKLDLLMAKDLVKTDLVGKSDPYAIISHGDQRYKSDIIRNTQNPEWNIQCELMVDSNPRERNISVELYDSDRLGKDKFLGKLDMDVGKIMNLGGLDQDWYPLDGVKQGQIRVGAEFVPDTNIMISQRFTETRRSSKQYQEVSLNRIPVPSTGLGSLDIRVRTPSGAVDIPDVHDDNSSGTVAVKYQPREDGDHYLDVRYNGDHVQGSPFVFHVSRPNSGHASAYGPGLSYGQCGEPALFTVNTKGAGAGGLHLAVEGPSKADITCHDNKDGTVEVSYLPTAPGEYKITAKFADQHIPGSPFTAKITTPGDGGHKVRNQISVGSSSELQLPGNLSETDLRSLQAYIESPSGVIEQCFLKKLPRGNIGISFTPREVGEHLVSVTKNGKHITNSPFKIMVNAQEVGDASRVKVSGDGLVGGKTHVYNRFLINTKSAGYGGLSLSIEGPSKAEIDCKDNEDGTLDVDYRPTEPGFYIINIKFADSHVPGSPFQVPISGEGSEKMTENIKRMREAVPVTEVGSQCRLTFKMPGIHVNDLDAMVTSPSGMSTKAHVSEEEEGLYAVNFVPYELGIHTVTVRYRDVDIPGSPFQFTVGPLQDSGAHRVHAAGPGLEQGVEGESAEFNVWTREAGPGSLAISVEGPSKAQIEFLDRKDGSCFVSYVVDEAGEYNVGIRFNDQHIPDSPYKVFISPKSDHADKVRITNLDYEEQIALNAPQSFLLNKNGASGTLQCKMVSPTGREDDCFMSAVGPDEYSVRFVPKEEGYHYLHAKLNGVHVPGSPFKIKVGGDGRKDGSVKVYGRGLERLLAGEKASFIIDTSSVGAGTLSVTVDGPSKVDMDCNEVTQGYQVSYTPALPGDYLVTVKYNGANVSGSPFKVTAAGGGQGGRSQMQRRESSSMTMETFQRTMIRQESSMFTETSKSSSMSRSVPISSDSGRHMPSNDGAGSVTCHGPGIDRPLLGKQNSFTVDCSRAGNNVLFVGIYGPEQPCDEVYVKHQGDRRYSVSYKLTDPGQYILYVKWGDQHVHGSPFHVAV